MTESAESTGHKLRVPKRCHSEERHVSRRIRKSLGSANAPPRHVHGGDWTEMHEMINKSSVHVTFEKNDQDRRHSRNSCSSRHAPSTDSEDQRYWIEETFSKRECCEFISSSKDPDKCGCGRPRNAHSAFSLRANQERERDRRIRKWTISRHTCTLPTDAFGTIEFQGGPHPYKANYLRLSFDSDPSQIMDLFEKVWQIPPPKLIITVHGGISNFDLQLKLARVFRKGLLKAARTTGAWIITSGINAGVVRHVAAALEGAISSSHKSRPRITCIGIAPWGLLKKREDFVGQDNVVQYHPSSFSPKGRFAVLNNRHSYYLLVDNGTVGRYGADIILRRQLEGYIVQKQKLDGGERSVPVVCVVLEGGSCLIRTVNDYVTNYPRIPVVVCDGSGRAADVLAFAQRYVSEKGDLPENIRRQLLALVKKLFGYDDENAGKLLLDIVTCVRQKSLCTVFRCGDEEKQEFDHAILTALLRGNELRPHEQFELALAWNRVDIAKSDIMNTADDWPRGALNDAMMEALIHHRVDFVRLLLENGVSMQKFLTIERLEQLYNTEYGPQNTLFYIVRDVVKLGKNYRYTLPHIGLAIEKLMGSGYRSFYTSPEFHEVYSAYRRRRAFQQKMADFSAGLNNADYFSPLSIIASGMGINLDDDVPATLSGSRGLHNHILWRSNNKNNVSAKTHTSVPAPASSSNLQDAETAPEDEEEEDRRAYRFKYPFSELLLWAVLTKRQDMALCMWEHGEEAMAKALAACRLYKSLAKEAAEDYLEVEICEELRKYADEFRQLSLELLDTCYKHDDAQTLQLLTYELKFWGHETCLSLAVIVNNKAFLAHPCCQILLADLWHGGLRIRSNSNFKVVLGLLCFPSIFFLEFKSQEELKKQPQTLAEHEGGFNNISDDEDSGGSSTSSSSSASEDDYAGDRRKSTGTSKLHHNWNKKRRQPPESRDYSNSVSIVEMAEPDVAAESRRAETRKRAHTLSFKRQKHKVSPGTEGGKTFSISPLGPEVIEAGGRPESPRRKPSSFSSAVRRMTVTTDVTPPKKLQKLTFKSLHYHKRQLRIRRKLYEFFVAPVTTFWSWFLSYLVFILLFTYSLLVKTSASVQVHEWYIYLYMLAFCFDSVRKLLMSEPQRLREKVDYFFQNYWHGFTAVAIVTFLVGAGCRIADEAYIPLGRNILAVSSVFWSLKLLDYLSIHPKFGPLVTMAGKMVLRMTYVVVMLALSMFCFGLARQSIMFPHEEWDWLLVRNIFYKPYFMFYGEVYAGEIDVCNDEIWEGHLTDGVSLDVFRANFTDNINCVTGHWIPPILMTIFLLITDILLMSLLIAVFNHTYNEVSAISQQIWLFQRYRQVMEFESTPFLPPPFTLIYHVYMVAKYLINWCRVCPGGEKRRRLFDFTLKLFLTPEQVEKVHDFEEECMEAHGQHKEYEKHESNKETLHRTAERADLLLVRMNDLISKEGVLKADVNLLEERVEGMEQRQQEILDYLKQMSVALLKPAGTIPVVHEPAQTCDSCQGLLAAASPSRRTSSMSPGSSFRRRRHHGEYTSITDTIDVEGSGDESSLIAQVARNHTQDDYDEEDYNADSDMASEDEPLKSKRDGAHFVAPRTSFDDDYADQPGPSFKPHRNSN